MKVYLAIRHEHYESIEILGVFDSAQKAVDLLLPLIKKEHPNAKPDVSEPENFEFDTRYVDWSVDTEVVK